MPLQKKQQQNHKPSNQTGKQLVCLPAILTGDTETQRQLRATWNSNNFPTEKDTLKRKKKPTLQHHQSRH